MASALDKLLGSEDTDLTTPSVDLSIFPTEVRKRILRQKAIAAGEDPRITSFYDKQDILKSILPTQFQKSVLNKQTQDFFTQNPDLDPSLANETVISEKARGVGKFLPWMKKSKDVKIADETAAQIVQQALSQDKQAQKEAGRRYNELKSQFSPGIRQKYSLDELEAAGAFNAGQPRTDSVTRAVQGAAQPFLSRLAIPQQLNAAAIANLKRGNFSQAGQNLLAQFLPSTYAPNTTTVRDSIQGLDLNNDQRLNLREVLGKNPSGQKGGLAGDIGVRGAEFLFSAITDPTLLFTGGEGGLAKAGFSSLEDAGLQGLAQKIRGPGWSALTDAEQNAVREAVFTGVQKTEESGAMTGAKTASRAEEQLTALQRRGRSGVRFAGRTVLPVRLRGLGGATEEVASQTATQAVHVNSWELEPGDTISPSHGLGDATVVKADPNANTVTVEPSGSLIVTKPTGIENVNPADLKPGMKLMKGDATVKAIHPDGTVEIEFSHALNATQRPFEVIRREGELPGGQGTLVGGAARKAEPGYTQGRLLVPEEYQARAQEAHAAAQPRTSLDEAISAVKSAPTATGAGGYGKIADAQLPKTPGVVKQSMEDGTIIGLRDAEGKLRGYLMATDDAINTFENLTSEKGVGQELLRAAQDAGLDVPKLLANSDFTEQGRSSALRYLSDQAKVVGREVASPVSERAFSSRSANIVLPESPTGNITKRRPWRSSGSEGRVIPDGSTLVDASGSPLGTINYSADKSEILLSPTGHLEGAAVGDAVPELFGRVVAKDADGTLHILPEQAAASMSPQLKQRLLIPDLPPEVRVPAAAEGAPLTGQSAAEFQAQGVTLKDAAELSEAAAYGPKPTDVIDIARTSVGRPGEAPPQAPQGVLFDRQHITIDEMKQGDRINALHGDVVSKSGKAVTFRLDDVPQTVERGNEIHRFDVKELKPGDYLPDANAIVQSVNKDGTVTLKAPLGAFRLETRTVFGGVRQTEPGVTSRVRGTAPVSKAAEAFIPRAEILKAERLEPGRVPQGAARQVESAMTQASTSISNLEQEINDIMKSQYKVLKKELGDEQALALLQKTVDVNDTGAGGLQAAADEYRLAGEEKTAQALESFLRVRDRIREAEKAGVQVDPTKVELMAAGNQQLPLILTKEGRKVLASEPALREVLKVERMKGLSAGYDFSERVQGRTLRIEQPDLVQALGGEGNFIEFNFDRPIREVNEQLSNAVNEDVRNRLGIASGEKIAVFDENPLTVFSMRGRTAFQKSATADMIFSLADQGLVRVIPDGELHAAARQEAAAAGMEAVPGFESPMGRTYAQPEIGRYITNNRDIIYNDDTLKSFSRFLNKWSAVTARFQTSPITKGVSFQMRNALTNGISILEDAANQGHIGQLPKATINAQRMMAAGRVVRKIMKEEGIFWDEAMSRAVDEGKVHPEIGGKLAQARAEGVIKEGFFRNLDWDSVSEQTKLNSSTKAKILAGITPWSPSFIITAPGRYVNQAVEDYFRLMQFDAVLEHTGSIDAASLGVKRTLYNYEDLTPFERKYMRSVNRFYTFARKNLGFQLSILAERPALLAKVAQQQALLMAPQRGANQLYPSDQNIFGTQQRYGYTGGALSSVLGQQGVVSFDTPLSAALKAVDPAVQASVYGMRAAGLKFNLPASEQPTLKSITKSVFDQTAGGPVEFLKAMVEFRTGKSLFNDANMKEDRGTIFRRFSDTMFPLWSSVGDRLNGADRAEILRLVTGINFYARTGDEDQRKLMYAYHSELQDVMDRLRSQGEDVPTISELRDAGILPTQAELDKKNGKTRTVSLTPEQKRQQARAALLGGGPSQTPSRGR